MIEDVDVLESHPLQTLIETRQQVLPGPPFPVRSGPHPVPGLGGDDEFVPVRGQILPQYPPERLLGGARRGPVVVREIEMRDTPVEGMEQHAMRVRELVHTAEVLPEQARNGGQLESTVPAPLVRHGSVPGLRSPVHRQKLAGWPTARMCSRGSPGNAFCTSASVARPGNVL